MFSFFNDGIKNTHPQKVIDLPELVNLIKNNPNKDKIDKIRILKREGDEKYKNLKRSLDYITPNCIVKLRNLDGDNFNTNFLQGSRYIFFDIDNIPNLEEYKEVLINEYGHLFSMVCISAGGDGLSILIRQNNVIASKDQFNILWDNISITVLKDLDIDTSTKDIGRAMFISYDPDVYYNFNNEVTIDVSDITPELTEKKGIKQSISGCDSINRLNEPFSLFDIKEVMDKICLKTEVNLENPIVDVYPVDYTSIRFPRVIQDGSKHRIYRGMIHSLVHLNPQLEVDYLFSYMNFINNYYAQPSMEFKKLVRLFNYEYKRIKDNKDYQYHFKKQKHIHFNPECGLTGDEKRYIANKLNGYRRRNESINKILLAKQELLAQGLKMTQKKVAELSGLGISTVKRHYNAEPVDLSEFIKMFENEILTKDDILMAG